MQSIRALSASTLLFLQLLITSIPVSSENINQPESEPEQAVTISCKSGEVYLSGTRQFGIEAFMTESSSTIPLQWKCQSASAEAPVLVSGKDTSGKMQILREISLSTKSEVNEKITIKNLSQEPLQKVGLSINMYSEYSQQKISEMGLAGYLYDIQRFQIPTESGVWKPADRLIEYETFAIWGRHQAFFVRSGSKAKLHLNDASKGQPRSAIAASQVASIFHHIDIVSPGSTYVIETSTERVPTSIAKLDDAGYQESTYLDLWAPIKYLSRFIERTVAAIANVFGNIGVAVMVFAIVVRVITLPITYWSYKAQRTFKNKSEAMKPELDEIRGSYKGAEQSERILTLYKKYELSPFSGLKGSVGLFIQIPFLLAFFQVTTASSIFENIGFLWISDLSLSDSVAIMPFSIPFLGNSLNVLPLLLAGLNIFTIKQELSTESGSGMGAILFSVAIVLIFYSFSAAVVLYWLTINVLQIAERRLFAKI